MSYLKKLETLRCVICKFPVRAELINKHGEHVAYYCEKHGKLANEKLNEREKNE